MSAVSELTYFQQMTVYQALMQAQARDIAAIQQHLATGGDPGTGPSIYLHLAAEVRYRDEVMRIVDPLSDGLADKFLSEWIEREHESFYRPGVGSPWVPAAEAMEFDALAYGMELAS